MSVESDEIPDKENWDGVRFPDLTVGAELTGCTAMQEKLAQGLLVGMNQTQAARFAGYKASSEDALRSTASTAARSKKVLALLAWAEAEGLGVPSAPVDQEELLRILSRHVRSADRNASIKAAEALHRINTHIHNQKIERGRIEEESRDPRETLDLAVPTLGVVVTYALAQKFKIDWTPKSPAQPGELDGLMKDLRLRFGAESTQAVGHVNGAAQPAPASQIATHG